MSLFQTCDWWRAAPETQDTYDTGSLVVANVDNAADGQDKVVTGSLEGTLRIYRPMNAALQKLQHSAQRSRAGTGKEDDGKADDDARLASGFTALVRDTATSGSALLLEERLGAPILQLAVGRFSAPAPGQGPPLGPHGQLPLSLAILQPSKLLVVYVLSVSGPGGGLRLGRAYEHSFAAGGAHFAAANMCVCPSTHQGGPDGIAVQSLDGQVSVYEGDRPSYRTALPGILLPAPIVQVGSAGQDRDTLVTLASDMVLHGYREAALAAVKGAAALGVTGQAVSSGSGILDPSGQGGQQQASSAQQQPAVQPAWSINLGEHSNFIMAGHVMQRPGVGTATGTVASAPSMLPPVPAPSDIVVLGQRTMFVISTAAGAGATGMGHAPSAGAGVPTGANSIKLQKRLGFTPVAACLVPAEVGPGQGSMHNIMLVSPTGVLHVLRGAHLAWAARLPFVPCAMAVGSYGGTAGLLTLLSYRGEVAVVYLGSEPPGPGAALTGGSKETAVGLGSAAGSDGHSVDYAAMEAEHLRLQAAIRQATEEASGTGQAAQTAGVLSIQPTVPDSADDPSGGRHTMAGVQLPASAPADVSSSLRALGTMASPLYPSDWERWEDGEDEMGHRQAGRVKDNDRVSGHVVTIKLDLRLASSSTNPVRNVTITAQPPAWTALPKLMRSVHVPWVGQDTCTVHLPIKARRAGIPDDQSLKLVVTYSQPAASSSAGGSGAVLAVGSSERGAVADGAGSSASSSAGSLRVITLSIPLPLCLAMRVLPPVKTGTFKVTIDINRPAPPPLSDLFNELLSGQPASHSPPDDLARAMPTAPGVLTFGFPSGADCTILASKQAGRFRVQSGVFEALLPVAAALVARLRRHYRNSGSNPNEPALTISFTEALPLPEVGQAVEDHLAARHALLRAHAALSDRAQEYRLVAKRLLVRFKDRSPAPLAGLDLLLEAAADHIQAAGQAVEDGQAALAGTAARLSSCLSLLLLLIGLKHPGMADGLKASVLASYLNPRVSDSSEQGWEEAAEAALTGLLKGGQAGAGGTAGSALAIPEDAGRLKRLLAVLADRLSKGTLALPSA